MNMKKTLRRLAPRLLLVSVFLILFSTAGWSATGDDSATPDGFSIYLAAGDLDASEIPKKHFGRIKLQEEPIVSGDDIIAYNGDTHEMTLTSSAHNRLMNLDLRAPFVVCVGGERIYGGNFVSAFSSWIPDGAIISTPPDSSPYYKSDNYTTRIDFFYSSNRDFTLHLLNDETEKWFKGTDPRSDPKILHALEIAGKLKKNLRKTE